MTEQEIFDTVVAHARKQGHKSLDDTGEHCTYRHGQDKCFAGALIPDNVYSTGMEQIPVGALLGAYTVADVSQRSMENTDGTLTDQNLQDLRGLGLREHLSLVEKLQKIHDELLPRRWEEEFKYVAKTHSLNYSAPGVPA